MVHGSTAGGFHQKDLTNSPYANLDLNLDLDHDLNLAFPQFF